MSSPHEIEPRRREHVERLQRVGLRATAPRLAVLEVLEAHRGHPAADEVWAALRRTHPTISRSTVYKTLEAFVATGLCRRITGDGTRLRVDGTRDDHHHAVCRECGTIFDVAPDVFPLPSPPARLPDGLSVTGVRLEFDVICADCRETAPTAVRESRQTTCQGGPIDA